MTTENTENEVKIKGRTLNLSTIGASESSSNHLHLFQKNGKVLKLFCKDRGPITNENILDFEVSPVTG